MSLYTEYLTPAFVGDAGLSPNKGLPVYGESTEWKGRQAKKARGSLHVPASPDPLDRHDFAPRHGYTRTQWLDTTSGGCSPVNALLTGLTMGKNNHSKLLRKLGATPAVNRMLGALTDEYGAHTNDPYSLADVLSIGINKGLLRHYWRISNYDQLICRIATTGPVLVTLQWYDHFLSDDTISTRAEKPWGVPQGLTSLVVSGYSANGMLLRLEHHELWKKPSFQILEDDFVDLLNEGGEVFAFEPELPSRVGLGPFYRARR